MATCLSRCGRETATYAYSILYGGLSRNTALYILLLTLYTRLHRIPNTRVASGRSGVVLSVVQLATLPDVRTPAAPLRSARANAFSAAYPISVRRA